MPRDRLFDDVKPMDGKTWRRRGRRVAQQEAVMPRAVSVQDHSATSVVAYRKSSLFESVWTYGIRAMVAMEALCLVLSVSCARTLVDRPNSQRADSKNHDDRHFLFASHLQVPHQEDRENRESPVSSAGDGRVAIENRNDDVRVHTTA